MYISGQFFHAQCQWNLDDRYPIVFQKDYISTDDKVFMKMSDIPLFLSSSVKNVDIIIHNSDETFEQIHYEQLKNNVNTIYSVNCNVVAVNVVQIPLGFRDDMYTSHSVMKNEYGCNKPILCLVNFLIATNTTERQKVHDLFSEKSFVTVQDYYKYDFQKSLQHNDTDTQSIRKTFYETLSKTKFAICPPGTGQDTHRVYECLFYGVVPIVKSSFLDNLYTNYNILIVKEWEDVSEELLISFVSDENKKFDPLKFKMFSHPDITFITYGDELYKASKERIIKEAKHTGIFKTCIGYGLEDLDEDFKKTHTQLLSQQRGGGYWCWKPYIILKTMLSIQKDEWILYADAGCCLIYNRKPKVTEIIKQMESNRKSILAYQMNHQLEKKWTKTDLQLYLDTDDNTGQLMATSFLVKNNKKMRDLFSLMIRIMQHHPELVDDSPSNQANDETFSEHRHDQSLFSLLRKHMYAEDVYVMNDETYGGNDFVQAVRLKY